MWEAMVMALSTVLNAAVDARLEVYCGRCEHCRLSHGTLKSFPFLTPCPFSPLLRVSSIISEDSLMALNKNRPTCN